MKFDCEFHDGVYIWPIFSLILSKFLSSLLHFFISSLGFFSYFTYHFLQVAVKVLKKEIDNLKVKASKVETIAMAAIHKFEDESQKLKELQAQFTAADDIRQEAYEELRNFKKGQYEKDIQR